MQNYRLDESQDGIKIAEKKINLKNAGDTTLMADSEKEVKSHLMKVKEEWKGWLKTLKKKTKIMASDPITSWQIEGGKVEAVRDFLSLGSKITANDDHSH